MASKDQKIADDLIVRGVDLTRFTAGERIKVFERLKRIEDELTELLFFSGRKLSDISRADKARLLRQAQEAIEQYYGEISKDQAATLGEIGRIEANATAASFEAAFASAIVPSLPTETFFKKLIDNTLIQGAPSAQWWANQAADVTRRFQLEVSQGLAMAETNDQIITRIRGRAVSWKMVDGKRVYTYAGGVMQIARHHAASQVATSVQTVANAARFETFKENEDVIKGYRQVSTLDSHTTLVCVAYSGAEWKNDAARTPIPPTTLPFLNPTGSPSGTPRHWSCRSILAPITKTFRELGIDLPEPPETTRAATGGPISAKMSFDDFLQMKEKSSKGFTDDLLGDGRAELWRKGDIRLDQLLDQTGRPLSLEELRRKYAGK